MLNAMVRSFIGQNKTAFLVIKNLAIVIIPVAYTYFLGFAMVNCRKEMYCAIFLLYASFFHKTLKGCKKSTVPIINVATVKYSHN